MFPLSWYICGWNVDLDTDFINPNLGIFVALAGQYYDSTLLLDKEQNIHPVEIFNNVP